MFNSEYSPRPDIGNIKFGASSTQIQVASEGDIDRLQKMLSRNMHRHKDMRCLLSIFTDVTWIAFSEAQQILGLNGCKGFPARMHQMIFRANQDLFAHEANYRIWPISGKTNPPQAIGPFLESLLASKVMLAPVDISEVAVLDYPAFRPVPVIDESVDSRLVKDVLTCLFSIRQNHHGGFVPVFFPEARSLLYFLINQPALSTSELIENYSYLKGWKDVPMGQKHLGRIIYQTRELLRQHNAPFTIENCPQYANFVKYKLSERDFQERA